MIRRALTLLLVASTLGWAGEWSAEELAIFERAVRPVLAEHCYECHSVDAKKVKGGLLLDSREGALEGGETDAALVPGKPEESPLIEAVRYHNVDFQMPPRTQLSAEEVAVLERWVSAGAPWPEEPRPVRGADEEVFDLAGRKAAHWCWQPMRKEGPPKVRDGDWPRGAIDQFVLAKLEEAGLSPARDADRGTFLRRVSFDLIGLPPTPEELAEFRADQSPEAVARVVDRLLASPHFGEKWARHWLDLVRYAESYGHEFDYDIPHAVEYRDYVIRACNDDVPYDVLLSEHIAGDLLPEPRRNPEGGTNESVIGTGFWFLGEAVHAPTDSGGDEAGRVDNQIDVFSRAFLGLTVACARCHDHKFDAISARDYYSLAGFLHSTRRAKVMLDPGARIAKGAAELRALHGEAMALVSEVAVPPVPSADTEREVIVDFDKGMPEGWTVEGEAFAQAPTPMDRATISLGSAGLARVGVMDSGLYGNKLQGVLRSPNFVLEGPEIHFLMRVEGAVQVRVVIDGYFMHEYHPLLFDGTMLAEKTITTGGKWAWRKIAHDLKKYVGKEVYLEFSDLGVGSLAIDEIAYVKRADPVGTKPALAPEVRAALGLLYPRAREIETHLPGPKRVLGVVDGPAHDEPIHIRGNHAAPGELAPRGMLTALGGRSVAAREGGSGRKLLAEGVVDPENPLTARVMVNRLWHHLTGRGIVATVDDFGVMGVEPTHPELLDWLARDFVAQGWSMKGAIREIVLSRTYAMSCVATAEAEVVAKEDPENLLLHRFRVRRLTGEAIRDGLLANSGRLDGTVYGPSVPGHLTRFMTGRGRPKENGPLDGDGRRSIYLAIRRNFLSPFQQAFDMPSPFSTMGRRAASNVPAQALVLMNDPFVVEQAKTWGERLCSEFATEEERITRAYLEAFAREPSEEERAEGHGFLQAQAVVLGKAPEDVAVWADFCHVLCNQKEYIFLK